MRKTMFVHILLVASISHAQDFNTVKLGQDKNIGLKIPNDFISMSDQSRMKQIYSSKVPLAMFTTEVQDVTLGVNYNAVQWEEDGTELMYGFYKASLQNLFDEIAFIQDDIRKVHGKEFIVFEFVGTIIDDNAFSSKKPQKNYTYIQYTSWNNQVLLFNFSCKARLKKQYQQTANIIMESVKIK